MELLEQYFDAAFATPDGIQKLRDLILTLAMQGKLVPQDPSDRPTRELLETIDTEKKRLLKVGRRTVPKPLPIVAGSDAPYKLPQGWQWVCLGSIGNIFNGNSINASEKELKYAGSNGLPYIATKDVGYGFDPLNYDNGICIPPEEDKFRVARKGSLLICAEGGSAGKKCGMTDRDICFGNKLFANELYGQIPSRYILYIYLSPGFRALFAAAMTGIIGGVSIARFIKIPIPLAPLEEQYRIVSKVDQLMARCDELEALRKAREDMRLTIHTSALSELLGSTNRRSAKSVWKFVSHHFEDIYYVKQNIGELRKAILCMAIEGKLTEQLEEDGSTTELLNKVLTEKSHLLIPERSVSAVDSKDLGYLVPDSWAILPLGALLIFGPSNGYSPKAVDYETKVRSLTLSATTSGVFKGEHSKFIAENVPENSNLWLQDGDILVQRGNAIEYVGVPAIYRGEGNKYIYPDLMMKLRISKELDCEYICFAMSAPPSRNFLRDRATGTSGTMPKINQKTLTLLPIPIPPLAEQHRIVVIIKKLMQQCDQLETQIDAANLKSLELLDAVIAKV